MRLASRVVMALVCLSTFGADQGKFAGSAACRGCHAPIATFFFRNPHFKSQVTGKPPVDASFAKDQPDAIGCESCHGPGHSHIAAKGDKKLINAFSLMSPKETLDNCLQCHSRQFPRSHIRRSAHTTGEVACTSCHSIHKTATPKLLLAKSQPELCYGCHTNIRAQFAMPFKHRVNEGFMQCTDCHNPHGVAAATWRMAARPRMVDQSLLNEQACLKCHVDQRGPFAFEHAGVRVEGCETCHSPHGSANARLLKRPQVFTLCLECHNGAGSFGRQADGVIAQSPSHSMTNPRYQNCTACHVRIHGSNADARFLR